MTIDDIVRAAIAAVQDDDVFVFPTRPGSKAPATKNGHKDASQDPRKIERMFRDAGEGCGIAVNLKMSGLVAIDWDAYKNSGDDREAITRLKILEQTRRHDTQSGGVHWIFDDAGRDRFPGAAGETIDIKHDGYVLWPPTKGYQSDGQDIMELPEEVEAWIDERAATFKRRVGATGTGVLMCATADEAIEVLRQDLDGQRHEAMLRITLDLARANPGASTSALMQEVDRFVRGKVTNIGPRLQDLLDAREGGELWRMCAGATERADHGMSPELARQIAAEVGPVPGPIVWAARGHEPPPKINTSSLYTYNGLDKTSLSATPWLYGTTMIRGQVSITAGHGGTGKSLLALTEAIAMASGRPLMGSKIWQRTRVLYWNGEDSLVHLQKRVAAALDHYKLTSADLGHRLMLADADSMPLRLVIEDDYGKPVVQDKLVDMLRTTLQGVDVWIIDPFIACHRVSESDNGAMEAVMAVLRGLAQDLDIAIEVIHHTRKGTDASADAIRGASAIVNAARSARLLRPLSPQEQGMFQVDDARTYAAFEHVKSNLALSEGVRYLQKVSVNLGNGGGIYPDGDDIPVAVRWAPPARENLLLNTVAVAQAIDRTADPNQRRDSARSPGWAGFAVARHLKLDVGENVDQADRTQDQKNARAAVASKLNEMVREGHLELVQDARDTAGHVKYAYVCTFDPYDLGEAIVGSS